MEYEYNDFEIIDSHTHIFPVKIAQKAVENISNFYNIPVGEKGSSEDLIECAKEIGVKMSLVCSTATNPAQTHSINQFIKSECDIHSEFFGFGTLHPDYGDIEEEIENIISMGLHGVKLHPDFQKFRINEKKAYRIYEMLEGRLPVLIHMGDMRLEYSNPQYLKQVLEDFPNLKITAAHLGGYQRWEEALEYLKGKHENLRFDTSSSQNILPSEYLRKLINCYGVENCFFGTDYPMWNHKKECDAFLRLGYSHEEYRKMFSQNFKDFYFSE